jgi:hypothetical protein
MKENGVKSSALSLILTHGNIIVEMKYGDILLFLYRASEIICSADNGVIEGGGSIRGTGGRVYYGESDGACLS